MVTLIGMTPSQNPNLVVIGALHVDEIATSARPLTLGESNVVTWKRSAGGVASNVARAAATAAVRAAAITAAEPPQSEHPVTLIANCGDGAAGLALQQALNQAGVEVKATHKNVNHTGRYTAVLQPNGEVLVGLADVAQAEDIEVSHVLPHLTNPQPVSLVLDGNLNATCLEGLSTRYNLENNAVIGVCVSPEKAPRFLKTLPHLTALFCNLAEAKALALATGTLKDEEPKALASTLCQIGCQHIVMSLGINGVLITSADQQTHVAVKSIDNPITLNGPGDALAGATITQLSTSDITHQQLIYAVEHVGLPAARAIITGVHKAPQL